MKDFPGICTDAAAKDHFATRSGRIVDRTNPKASDHSIEDLAHSLSKICRFGGAVATFYSVGEHSLHVSEQLEIRYPKAHPRLFLAGLVHDGTEIALSDLLKPIKSDLPDYAALEQRYEATIAEAFGLSWPWPAEVHEVDTRMLVTEALALMPWTVSSHWLAKGHPLKLTVPDRRFIVIVVLTDGRVEDFSSYPGLVEAAFLKRFHELTARIAEMEADR